jgi:hypothetical protein
MTTLIICVIFAVAIFPTFRNPPSGKPKPMGTGLLGHPATPLNNGQVGQCKIQAVVRNKRGKMHISKGYNDQK